MQKNLLLVFFVFFLSNCKPSVIEADLSTDSAGATAQSGLRKPHTETIVILGSSTASGWGASSYKYSWAGLLANHTSLGRVINLAKGGYTSYHILPNETAQPAGRPAVDTLKNITAALKLKPTTLIISMTTNDIANGFSVDEIMANLNAVRARALAAGVDRIIITTSHPRKINAVATAKYILQRDQILKTYGVAAANFFDPVANEANLFKEELLCNDGIHPNDKGHAVLFKQMKKVLSLNLLR